MWHTFPMSRAWSHFLELSGKKVGQGMTAMHQLLPQTRCKLDAANGENQCVWVTVCHVGHFQVLSHHGDAEGVLHMIETVLTGLPPMVECTHMESGLSDSD